MNKKIMLMAGELSGDMHGAYLVQAIKKACPDCTFYGVGGSRMREAGVDIITDIVRKSTIGFLGNLAVIIANLPLLLKLIKKIKNIFIFYKPDVLVLIDNQGLNMYFAAMAKKYNIKTVYYIPPQEWLWGTKEGAIRVVTTVDKVITILEKEYVYYKGLRNNVEYFGHPLLDIIPRYYQDGFANHKEAKTIGLFPGSRKQEIEKLTPLLKEIAQVLYSRDNELRFLVAISDKSYIETIQKSFSMASIPIEFVEADSYSVISRSQVVVGASGTLALECVIMQTPMVVLYRLPKLDYFFAKKILKIKVEYISLPNIIMDEMILPEFIQEQIDNQKIADVILEMLNNKQFYTAFLEKVKNVRAKLGEPGVLESVAQSVLSC
ncbi:MAG: lipid-A-disaccharide synthase [Candidatus Margulisiibacteriota bacterium]|nr:MAG: lipid-A-disaccharide synthase [Candidatus Margulisbacteria bacterium GWD2_39_127]OGI03657.1 MAG: lipid-A-disaccharide synthase [Candidatus Margulisbacteria bacterium GWF2_38_17]OGI05649.1 MAG: lipid-A-disaccharide synthase [Candidatus Margulisbacteria bacterium GWE2_39_32]PZM82240.1 MAG: lipid-A-disaccharide synthase [Candidatus Margulisiibacteriota bacterium]HAR63718.1 lipid-A-disaccharide synthase [Candidatus Margulisiibacteriota bacterium]